MSLFHDFSRMTQFHICILIISLRERCGWRLTYFIPQTKQKIRSQKTMDHYFSYETHPYIMPYYHVGWHRLLLSNHILTISSWTSFLSGSSDIVVTHTPFIPPRPLFLASFDLLYKEEYIKRKGKTFMHIPSL